MPDPSIPLGSLNHVALLTTDARRGEDFYCSVLGFRTVPRPSFSFDGSWLAHDAVGVMLHLIHRADPVATLGKIDTLNGHFAISCTNIEAAAKSLAQHGVVFVERKLPDYGYRQLFFRDPDGNLIELGEWPEIPPS